MENYDVGERVEITTKDEIYTGILMERPRLAEDNHVVIKLDSGYNLGIRKERILAIKPLGMPEKEDAAVQTPARVDASKKNVSILATGGTIASRVDYITGGVHSAFSAEELIGAVPELAEVAGVQGRQVFNKFSENIVPSDWATLAEAVHDEIKKGAQGVVITHGTDTMGYSAAALAFMLKTPVPVVFTGAQRSSDRGSSDAAMNLLWSTRAATQEFSEVAVVMHAQTSDSYAAIHPATRVKKMHSSKRAAFQSVNHAPLGRVYDDCVDFAVEMKKSKESCLDTSLEERVFLLKYFPGMPARTIDLLVAEGYRGIVIEGTGLGHTCEAFAQNLRDAIGSGVHVAMASQTIHGRVNMNVYSTGRMLLDAGLIPCGDMLSETAYVKLMWTLGHTKDPAKVKAMMQKEYARELSPRSMYENACRH